MAEIIFILFFGCAAVYFVYANFAILIMLITIIWAALMIGGLFYGINEFCHNEALELKKLCSRKIQELRAWHNKRSNPITLNKYEEVEKFL